MRASAGLRKLALLAVAFGWLPIGWVLLRSPHSSPTAPHAGVDWSQDLAARAATQSPPQPQEAEACAPVPPAPPAPCPACAAALDGRPPPGEHAPGPLATHSQRRLPAIPRA